MRRINVHFISESFITDVYSIYSGGGQRRVEQSEKGGLMQFDKTSMSLSGKNKINWIVLSFQRLLRDWMRVLAHRMSRSAEKPTQKWDNKISR